MKSDKSHLVSGDSILILSLACALYSLPRLFSHLLGTEGNRVVWLICCTLKWYLAWSLRERASCSGTLWKNNGTALAMGAALTSKASTWEEGELVHD